MVLSSLFLIGPLGGSEVVIILVVLLLFFGAKKIPELARGLGKGVKEFKDATTEMTNSVQEGMNGPTTPPVSPVEQQLRDANAREAALRAELERERAARAASPTGNL